MDFKSFTYENPEEIEQLAEALEDFNEKFSVILEKSKTEEKYKELVWGEPEDDEDDEGNPYYSALCKIYDAMKYGAYDIPV